MCDLARVRNPIAWEARANPEPCLPADAHRAKAGIPNPFVCHFSTAVMLRFGESPTMIFVTTVREGTSTTVTESVCSVAM